MQSCTWTLCSQRDVRAWRTSPRPSYPSHTQQASTHSKRIQCSETCWSLGMVGFKHHTQYSAASTVRYGPTDSLRLDHDRILSQRNGWGLHPLSLCEAEGVRAVLCACVVLCFAVLCGVTYIQDPRSKSLTCSTLHTSCKASKVLQVFSDCSHFLPLGRNVTAQLQISCKSA